MAITLKAMIASLGSIDANGNVVVDVSGMGLTAGDFVIVGVAEGNTLLQRPANGVTGNVSGAFNSDAALYANDTRDINASCFSKTLTGADTTLSINPSGSVGAARLYTIRAYRSTDPDTSLDVAVQTATGINTDLADPPPITPVTPGAKIVTVYFASQYTGMVDWTPPADVTNFVQYHDSSQNNAIVGSGDVDWNGNGAFDPAPPAAGQANARASWAAVTYALRPAAGAAPTSTGKVKVSLSGVFVEKPVKVLMGGVWTEKPLKVFKSGVWVLA